MEFDLETDVCELIGTDTVTSSRRVKQVNSLGKGSDHIENDVKEHENVMTPILEQLQQAASDHLFAILSRRRNEYDEELRNQQSKFIEKSKIQQDLFDTTTLRLQAAETKATWQQNQYYLLAEKASMFIDKKRLYFRRQYLLSQSMTMWKNLIVSKKAQLQIEQVVEYEANKYSKLKSFCVLRQAFVKNKCEQERDEYVTRLDSIARKVTCVYMYVCMCAHMYLCVFMYVCMDGRSVRFQQRAGCNRSDYHL